MRNMSRSRVFTVVWLGLAVSLVLLQFFASERLDFVGIVGFRSQEITSTAAARVRKVHAISGQPVKKGDLLVELENSQLELELSQAQEDLNRLLEEREIFSELVPDAGATNPNILGLKKRISILQKQKDELFIFSKFDGKVDSVLKREGENVQPHIPVLTLSELVPSIVRGYLHESVAADVVVGSEVVVNDPIAASRASVKGRVVSFGSSMVPFPERLLRDPSRAIWGREVIIELPKDNQLILGEKVLILKAEKGSNLFTQAHAEEASRGATNGYEVTKKFDLKMPGQAAFQASGVTFLAALDKYLVVGDGASTTQNSQILLVDADGDSSADAAVDGVRGLDDFESVSQGTDGAIYVLSSLSSKHRAPPASRRRFLRLRREGTRISTSDSVSLYDLLETFVKNHPSRSDLRHLTDDGVLQVDVEGLAVDGESILLGLRSRLTAKNEALIYRISGLSDLFNGGQIEDLELAHELKLTNGKGKALAISDLSVCGKDVFIAAAPASKKSRAGAVFRLRQGTVDRLFDYEHQKPEGIHCHDEGKKLFLTFDHGEEVSSGVLYEQRL